jgi:hypothetical protein
LLPEPEFSGFSEPEFAENSFSQNLFYSKSAYLG